MTEFSRRYRFHGQVQGVGFRMTARRLALQHGIRGYVRNLPDGSVELLAAGDTATVQRYLTELRQVMGSYIGGVEEQAAEDVPETSSFEIRH